MSFKYLYQTINDPKINDIIKNSDSSIEVNRQNYKSKIVKFYTRGGFSISYSRWRLLQSLIPYKILCESLIADDHYLVTLWEGTVSFSSFIYKFYAFYFDLEEGWKNTILLKSNCFDEVLDFHEYQCLKIENEIQI